MWKTGSSGQVTGGQSGTSQEGQTAVSMNRTGWLGAWPALASWHLLPGTPPRLILLSPKTIFSCSCHSSVGGCMWGKFPPAGGSLNPFIQEASLTALLPTTYPSQDLAPHQDPNGHIPPEARPTQDPSLLSQDPAYQDFPRTLPSDIPLNPPGIL